MLTLTQIGDAGNTSQVHFLCSTRNTSGQSEEISEGYSEDE